MKYFPSQTLEDITSSTPWPGRDAGCETISFFIGNLSLEWIASRVCVHFLQYISVYHGRLLAFFPGVFSRQNPSEGPQLYPITVIHDLKHLQTPYAKIKSVAVIYLYLALLMNCLQIITWDIHDYKSFTLSVACSVWKDVWLLWTAAGEGTFILAFNVTIK